MMIAGIIPIAAERRFIYLEKACGPSSIESTLRLAITQLLSGHRYFKSYLPTIRKSRAPDVIILKDVVDDTCHTFFFSAEGESAIAITFRWKSVKCPRTP